MEAAKYRIRGSDFVGVFATATEELVFTGAGITKNNVEVLASTLGAKAVKITLSGSDLIGLFARGNSNGIVLSNLVYDEEVEYIKRLRLGINVGMVHSDLNAIGSNILSNDKIAIVNADYDDDSIKEIRDILGVEVIRAKTDGFKTVGANNILTNSGMVLNNRATESEKEELEHATGFTLVRSTANLGSLSVGLSAVANTKGVVAGDSTTGYELARITDALEA